MFVLSDADLQRRLLGCGDGPTSFNAGVTAEGIRVVSVDSIYAHSAAEIEKRVEATFETVVAQARQQAHRFVWDHFADSDALGRALRRGLAADAALRGRGVRPRPVLAPAVPLLGPPFA